VEIGRYFDRRWRIWASAKFFPAPHACIMAKDSQRGNNWSYDVGGRTKELFDQSIWNPLTVFPGILEKAPDRGDMAPILPVGRMTDWQLQIWEFLVLGGTNGADEPFVTPYPYIFAYQNCFTWTGPAAATARVVSLIPS
jgi:hypothetical protein